VNIAAWIFRIAECEILTGYEKRLAASVGDERSFRPELRGLMQNTIETDGKNGPRRGGSGGPLLLNIVGAGQEHHRRNSDR
jgi:hypothetical protein